MAVQKSQPCSAPFIVFESGDFVLAAELGQRGEISWETDIEWRSHSAIAQERHIARSDRVLTLIGMCEWGAMCYGR